MNSAFSGVVALDGPSGTGKSTVARRLAIRLDARYLDTGAMYRAVTLAVLEAGVALADPERILAVVVGHDVTISTDPTRAGVRLDGAEVDSDIRSARVTAAVSAVSAVGEVRALLVAQQRRLIGAGGIVVEGRDIGSVVWPEAAPKIYLTASAEVRAQRRSGEIGTGTDVAAVAADIDRRDRLDSTRAASPLSQADDATVVDTTHLDIDQVVEHLVGLVAAQTAG